MIFHMSEYNGWLSKLWSLFGYPKYKVPYYNKDPKRDPNIDNHPMDFGIEFGIPDDGTSAGLLQHGGSSRALPVEET